MSRIGKMHCVKTHSDIKINGCVGEGCSHIKECGGFSGKQKSLNQNWIPGHHDIRRIGMAVVKGEWHSGRIKQE